MTPPSRTTLAALSDLGLFPLEQPINDFEEAWQQGIIPQIEMFLPPTELDPGSGRAAPSPRGLLLEELVKIDLEYRWRRAANESQAPSAEPSAALLPPRPRLEHYLARFPELAEGAGPSVDLVVEEYRARRRWGDRPGVAEYHVRFSRLGEPLIMALAKASEEIASEHRAAAADTPVNRHEGSPAASKQPWEGVPSLDNFQILDVLGQGGMGIVYKARDIRLDRLVALKMIAPSLGLGEHQRARFWAEARAVARLQHPNIVRVYEIGHWDGRPYVVLELVEGGTLAQSLAGKTLPARSAAALVGILARAVHFAHQKGIVHRDLKPANILLTNASEDQGAEGPLPGLGTPKISDFGLAKWLDGAEGGPLATTADRTHTGAIVGTPNYMAPEQAEGRSQSIGPAADIHALGAILYEALTGRPPYRGPSMLETLDQVRSRPPVPPSKLQPKLARDLETICLKCLEKDPRRRYASAELLAGDLGRFLAGEPIAARPLRPWQRLARFAKRRPAVAALGAFSVLVSLALISGGIVYNLRLQAASRLAETRRDQAERNFQKAFEAVSQMLVRVGSERLNDVPEMEEVRRDLLNDALTFLNGFLTERDSSDPTLRHQLGLTYQNLGLISDLLGEPEQARANLQHAIAVQESLVAASPASWVYRDELARSHENLADVYRKLSDDPRARVHYQAALELWEPIARDHPAIEHELATGYHHFAEVLNDAAEPERAGIYYQKVLTLRERLACLDPAAYGHDLAMTRYNTGLWALKRGDYAEAERLLRACVAYWEPLARDHREARRYLRALAECCNSLGALYDLTGRPEQAEEVFKKGLALCTRLARQFPQVPAVQDTWARAYHMLATHYQGTGRTQDAETHYHEAIAIRETLLERFPQLRREQIQIAETEQNLAVVLQFTGRRAQARALLDRALGRLAPLAQEHPENPQICRAIGAICINLGESFRAEGQFEQALTMFDRAARSLETAFRINTNDLRIKHDLCTSLAARATMGSALKRYGQAVADWGRFFSLAEPADQDSYRPAASVDLVRAGAYHQATAHAPPPDAFPKLSGEDAYNWACVYALAMPLALADDQLPPEQRQALAARFETTALALLDRARAANFFRQDNMFKLLREDTDLDPLRSHEPFPRLVQQIERERQTPTSPTSGLGSRKSPAGGRPTQDDQQVRLQPDHKEKSDLK